MYLALWSLYFLVILRWETSLIAFLNRLLFDETWFISCISTEELVTRLTKRHLETWSEEKTKVWGAGINGARMKAEANDVLNAQFIIEKTMKFADRVIMN